MTTDERIDKLTAIVETLAGSVVAHDNQIEAHDRQIETLIRVAEIQGRRTDDLARMVEILSHRADGTEAALNALTQTVKKLAEQVAATERQWQAYLNTLPKN